VNRHYYPRAVFRPRGTRVHARLTRDDDNALAYLYLTEGVRPGQAVTQRTVSLSENEDDADLVLDFDAQGRLLGVEFLRQDHLPPGW
jgi:uncharacterized protein YuzE